jgi:peptidoglycan/LPS O-acetylase OafA/YrhL
MILLDLNRIPSHHPRVEKQPRIPELDGLRGVAILLVIFYHYTNGNLLTRADGLSFYVQRSAAGGWTGVDLFFVLSGFLIGGILIDARGSDSYFRTFYIRRFFRIIPIYYLWIGLYVALVAAAGAEIQAHSFSGKPLPRGFEVYAHFLFIQNFLPFTSSAVPGMYGAWFGHLWSLAVEEQFYLIVPLLIAWLSARRLPVALVGIVCCAPILRTILFFHVTRIDIAHIMVARADALALGIIAACVWRTPAARLWLDRNIGSIYWLTAVLLSGYGLLCWYTPGSESFKVVCFGFTWIGIFYSLLLLIVLTSSKGWVARVMRARWLREVGRVSYCMYIIHLMVVLFLYSVILHVRPQIVTFAGAAVAMLAAFVTYALARFSWAWFEGPLVRIGHEFNYSAQAADQSCFRSHVKPEGR